MDAKHEVFERVSLPADAVELGRIADAWGVKGWFKVHAYSAHAQALLSSPDWYLQPPPERPGLQFGAFSGTVQLPIAEARWHTDLVVARAHAVHDRDLAQSLKGARIFVPRSGFPAPEKDEYYWVDLIGLDVVNREHIVLGRVTDLLAAGGQSVLVVRSHEPAVDPSDSKESATEHLIPFVGHFVDAVELQQRRIRVDWQPDY